MLLERLVGLATHAPSVGNSQPWRFVEVADPRRRAAVRRNFLACNQAALELYEGEQAHLYATLKLAGLDEAPVHIAVFVDGETATGHGLGRHTMPRTLDYSAVLAVHTLWLVARAYGVGVGWVSILDPTAVCVALDVPSGWGLIAYLCLGYPSEDHLDPELERHGWTALAQDLIDTHNGRPVHSGQLVYRTTGRRHRARGSDLISARPAPCPTFRPE